MTNKRYLDSLWAFLLAAVLSFGGIGCVASGFTFPDVNMGALLLVSFGSGLVCAIACRYRFGILIAAAVGFVWLIWNWQDMLASWSALLYRISSFLYSGYKWPIMQWNEEIPQGNAEMALGMVACIVSLTVAWTVMGRKKATVTAMVAFLPLLVCLILTDTVPNWEYLLLLLGGFILLALTNLLRTQNARQTNRVTAILLVPVMLATMGLFQVFPKGNEIPDADVFRQLGQWLQENSLWQQLTGGASWEIGDFGNVTVSLDELDDRTNTNQTAFYVTSTESGYLYLRGRGYDTYDGRSWTVSEHSSGEDSGWPSNILIRSKVTVRMTRAQQYYYFSGDTGPSGEIPKVFQSGMLPNPDREITYTVLRGSPVGRMSISQEVREQCLELPEKTAAWAREELKKLQWSDFLSSSGPFLEGSLPQNRIANLVRNSAKYSLSPGRMPDTAEDFAQWFFTEADEGYCVHFATVATVLLRAAGIPARYVTGYALQATKGKEMNVQQSRAHAWVEYYIEGSGWTIMDPTPGYNNPDVQPEESTQPSTEATTKPTETTNPTEITSPTELTQSATEETNPTASQTDTTVDQDTQTQGDGGIAQKITAVLLWILGCSGVVWGQRRLRIQIRSWYMRRGDPNSQALARWKMVCARSRILRQRPPKRLYKLAEKAKYSQHRITAEELREFDRHMTALAASLGEKPWLNRWLLRLVFAIE